MARERAQVVIVGAGIAGASIAYHLAQLGQHDVVVVEQGALVSGTTSHAPGLVGQLRSSVSLTKLLMYSVSLYRDLRVDGNPGYQEVGSLRLASSKERLEELKRQAAFALGVGLEAHLLSPREVAELFPLMSPDAVEGALFFPHDGSAQAPVLARAMIDEAGRQGISFWPHTRVEAIEVFNGRVRALQTTVGRIETETLVIAAGIWSPVVGRMSGVSLPLTPMQHQYVTTGPIQELKGRTVPNLRDPDYLVYLRQDGDSLKVGGYEHDPAPYDADRIPQRPNPTTLAFDPARFDPLWRAAVERVPVLGSSALTREVNGLESFTPDGEFLLGPASEVQGIWAACGFCAHGVSGAGGVGRLMAEWIVEGEPSLDLWHMDLRRFGAYSLSSRYIRQRASEIYASYYAISHPGLERSS